MMFLITIFILLSAHLSIDKDFPQEVKTTSSVIFIIIGVLYVIFGLII